MTIEIHGREDGRKLEKSKGGNVQFQNRHSVIMPRGHCVISVFYPLGRKTHFMDDINGNGRGGGSKRGSMDFIDTLLPSSSRDRKANRRLDSSSR